MAFNPYRKRRPDQTPFTFDQADVDEPVYEMVEVVRTVLKGRRYAGVDSGVTHVAAQAIAAAKNQFGIDISLRLLFNAGVPNHIYPKRTDRRV